MSIQTREWVANHPHSIFQDDSQKNDLLDVNLTKTELIGFLQHMLQQGWIILYTSIRSDHSDDTDLSNEGPPFPGTHANGWAVDCWPLNTREPLDYIDAGNPHFQKFLSDAINAPFYLQTGLGGSAYSPVNMLAAGNAAFEDDGSDHIHFGTKQ